MLEHLKFLNTLVWFRCIVFLVISLIVFFTVFGPIANSATVFAIPALIVYHGTNLIVWYFYILLPILRRNNS